MPQFVHLLNRESGSWKRKRKQKSGGNDDVHMHVDVNVKGLRVDA